MYVDVPALVRVCFDWYMVSLFRCKQVALACGAYTSSLVIDGRVQLRSSVATSLLASAAQASCPPLASATLPLVLHRLSSASRVSDFIGYVAIYELSDH